MNTSCGPQEYFSTTEGEKRRVSCSLSAPRSSIRCDHSTKGFSWSCSSRMAEEMMSSLSKDEEKLLSACRRRVRYFSVTCSEKCVCFSSFVVKYTRRNEMARRKSHYNFHTHSGTAKQEGKWRENAKP